MDRVVVRGQLRRERLFHLLQRLVRVGLRHREEHVGGTREVGAGPLHRDDGVVERRRVRQRRDGVHLGEVHPHRLFDGRLVVAVLDVVERGRLVREGTRLGEGIHGLRRRWGRGRHHRGDRRRWRRGDRGRRGIGAAGGQNEGGGENEARRPAHGPIRYDFSNRNTSFSSPSFFSASTTTRPPFSSSPKSSSSPRGRFTSSCITRASGLAPLSGS